MFHFQENFSLCRPKPLLITFKVCLTRSYQTLTSFLGFAQTMPHFDWTIPAAIPKRSCVIWGKKYLRSFIYVFGILTSFQIYFGCSLVMPCITLVRFGSIKHIGCISLNKKRKAFKIQLKQYRDYSRLYVLSLRMVNIR